MAEWERSVWVDAEGRDHTEYRCSKCGIVVQFPKLVCPACGERIEVDKEGNEE